MPVNRETDSGESGCQRFNYFIGFAFYIVAAERQAGREMEVKDVS